MVTEKDKIRTPLKNYAIFNTCRTAVPPDIEICHLVACLTDFERGMILRVCLAGVLVTETANILGAFKEYETSCHDSIHKVL